MFSSQKNNYFLSFYSQIFHSKIHKHTGGQGGGYMDRDEQLWCRSKIRSFG